MSSTNLTEVKCIEDVEINIKLPEGATQIPEDTETRIMFEKVGDDSLLPQINCNSCNNILLKSTQKVILCESCHSCQIASSCGSKLMIKLNKSYLIYICESSILKNALPDNIEISQNKEYTLFMLSNTFLVT